MLAGQQVKQIVMRNGSETRIRPAFCLQKGIPQPCDQLRKMGKSAISMQFSAISDWEPKRALACRQCMSHIDQHRAGAEGRSPKICGSIEWMLISDALFYRTRSFEIQPWSTLTRERLCVIFGVSRTLSFPVTSLRHRFIVIVSR